MSTSTSAGRRKRTAGKNNNIVAGAELLRTGPAARFLGLGDTRFWQIRRDDPTFPAPVTLGKRAIAFRRTELLAWIEAKQS